jgi:hypothetical protein
MRCFSGICGNSATTDRNYALSKPLIRLGSLSIAEVNHAFISDTCASPKEGRASTIAFMTPPKCSHRLSASFSF